MILHLIGLPICHTTKKKLRRVGVDQEYVEEEQTFIVCSNTSRLEKRHGQRRREFYSVLDGAFASKLILLLTDVNEKIGARFSR